MRKPDAKSLGSLPSATGLMARLAYSQAKKAGIDVRPLLQRPALRCARSSARTSASRCKIKSGS